MAVQLTRRRFTVDEYHRMADAGVLSEDERVELIEGEIIDMTPIGVHHAHCVAQLTRIFVEELGRRALVWSQNPVRLGQETEVQPDIAVLRPRNYSRDTRAPGPEDVLLVIEVADTTLASDRKIKLPLYARAGIPEYWLVNLKDGIVEVHRNPVGEMYSINIEAGADGSLAVPCFPGVSVPVSEVLE